MSDMAIALRGTFFVVTDAGIQELEAADMIDKTETNPPPTIISEADARDIRRNLGTLLTHRLPRRSHILVKAMHDQLSRLLGEDDES